MQTLNIRNFINLSRSKIKSLLFLVFILASFSEVFAQRSRTINLENYDRRKIHYGFQAGMFNSFNVLKLSEDFTQRDSVFYVDALNTGGFSLGLIVNLALKDELWDLRFAPNFAFYQHQVSFNFTEEGSDEPVTDINMIEATMFEIPLLFMYKATRRMNNRMYMLGGLTYSLQVGGRVDETNQRTIIMNRNNLEITYGFGFHFYMQMFNLAPEVRFSHGLFNRLNQTNNPYSSNIERITSHKVTLILNFEG